VSFVLHPQDVPNGLALATLGTRYMLALVELNDDETPKEVMPDSKRSTVSTTPETSPHTDADNAPRGARKWNELSPAQQAGILCSDAKFRLFVAERTDQRAENIDSEEAAQFIRISCAVDSRKKILPGSNHAELWDALVSRFRAWERAPSAGIDQ